MALTDNLVSYWSLDEASGGAIDAHGSNDLTSHGSPEPPSVTGKVNNARDFEETNSTYFSHTDNSDLSLGTDSDFTFTCWVQLESKTNYRMFVTKFTEAIPTSDNQCEYSIRYDSVEDKFRFLVGNGSSFGNVIANTLGSPSTGAWYFIIAWHDSVADTLNIQVNNGSVDSTGWSGGTQDGSQDFEMGRQPSFYHDGLLDEVGFWKRVLTSDERTDLYNSGSGRDYTYISSAAIKFTQLERSIRGLNRGLI